MGLLMILIARIGKRLKAQEAHFEGTKTPDQVREEVNLKYWNYFNRNF